MTRLLVSVRTAAEAMIALEGGAALIDVKEPAQGPLGMAPRQTIAEVVRVVAGRVPVSAALGELRDGLPDGLPFGVAFFKWGLAGLGALDWRAAVERAGRHLSAQVPQSKLVLAGYADWVLAQAPPCEAVIEFALQRRDGGLLLDTYDKSTSAERPDRRRSLLDYLSVPGALRICEKAAAVGIKVALAGSLGRAQIERLLPANPDWFGVRSAVCEAGERGGSVLVSKVRELTKLIEADPGEVRYEN